MVRSRKLSILLALRLMLTTAMPSVPGVRITGSEASMPTSSISSCSAGRAAQPEMWPLRTAGASVERHLLRWGKGGVEHVVDGGVGDGGQQVFALVLGELVLVDGEELLGVAAR